MMIWLFFAAFALISSTKGQEISNIKVNPDKILSEAGKLYRTSIQFTATNLDKVHCNFTCPMKAESFIQSNPSNNGVYSCMYWTRINATSRQICSWKIGAKFIDGSFDTSESMITFGKSITGVDRKPLIVSIGSRATLNVVPADYPDELMCKFERQERGYEKNGCTMVINKIGTKDAGIHNISICLPGSTEDGCVHVQKEVIVLKCTFHHKNVSVSITDTEGRVHLECMNACSNLVPDDIVQGNKSTVFTWNNVTDSPFIQGFYNNMMISNSSCDMETGMEDLEKAPNSNGIIGGIIGGVIGCVVFIALIMLCYRKRQQAKKELEESVKKPLNEGQISAL